MRVIRRGFHRWRYKTRLAFIALLAYIFCFVPSISAHAESIDVDFDAAMHGVGFDLKGDNNGASGKNGIPDATEMALVSAILKESTLDLSQSGGISHQAVFNAYQQAQESASSDISLLRLMWPTAVDVTVGYALLGKDSFAAISEMITGFGASLDNAYEKSMSLDRWLSAAGDADGDGASNLQEYRANQEQGRAAYIQAALDPDVTPTVDQLRNTKVPESTLLTVGIILYPGFEVLDVYGPLEMWSYVPDFKVVLIAENKGPVKSAQGTSSIATHSFDTAPKVDIVMVPGGVGTKAQLNNPRLLEYLKMVHQQSRYTASVCTGSALLAKAGILDGHRATTNKRFFFLAEEQSDQVDWVADARWVESGKLFTSSGVSAGMDMALGLVAKLYGKDSAKQLASAVEYTWQDDPRLDEFTSFINRSVKIKKNGEHALVKSEPSSQSQLPNPPNALRLYFSNKPVVEKSQVRLYQVGKKSKQIPLHGMHNMGQNDLMFMIGSRLTPGEYKVEWQAGFQKDATDAKNTIDLKGSFRFTVQAAL